MGGTSCDVCVIEGGRVRETAERTIAGRPLALPALDIDTVGAGGGSIAWRDAGGALRVGPRSAGAEPGPACYGRGGSEPTVTDANLMLGYLSSLAGGLELDAPAAERAVERLARELGLKTLETAQGIIRVANAEMVRALRVVTVERGIDPRRYALLAFGGAGPLHAAAIADELGIATIVCPAASGVLAALGLVVSPHRRDVQRTVMLEELDPARISQIVAELGGESRTALGVTDAELEATYELRYRGQSFELAVKAPPDRLREAFEALHEERYGYRAPEQAVELVTVRVSAVIPGADVELAGGGGELMRSRRSATIAGESIELDVLRGVPAPGTAIAGPAVVELPESTLLVPPQWSGEVDRTGTIRLERRQ
jgi:N-methylhydantoinase A